MKKILITGANSYIGTSVERWLGKYPDKYYVDTIDMKGETWKNKDFSEYDVVFHVAGIAYIKETKENNDLYYKVNRDLAYETAKKAKEDGVKQFIFLSTMSVYGIVKGVIDEKSPLNPMNNYGKSKLQAEVLINSLQDTLFSVATLRPPMVYGKDCRGNYSRLAGIALKTPIFPKVDNKRSMIYIDNFSEFVKQLVDNRSGGIFFPQNSEYVNTSEMVRLIAEAHGKKIRLTKVFNPLLKLFMISTINKVFGDLVYKIDKKPYVEPVDFEESIELTEK